MNGKQLQRRWIAGNLRMGLIFFAIAVGLIASGDGANDLRRLPPKVAGSRVKMPSPCEQSSCYPATGNLLIGRESRLRATSTCGIKEPQRFCQILDLHQKKKCNFCDARDPLRHKNITNIVKGANNKRWWQAENGIENVSITLDLEAEFHFTHCIITSKTFRPAAMLIERSYDYGKTWQVYRYFAHNCAQSFPGISTQPMSKLTDVICESKYSKVEPSEGGEIIFRVLPSNLHIENPYIREVQNLVKVTNIRFNFTRLHTLGDDLLDNRNEIREKYFYAITEIVVRGSCSCYGHASRCLRLPGDKEDDENLTEMVRGRCECKHNTMGLNCESCLDFYNDLPWKPAVGKQTNACRKCNCNNHSTKCHFDPVHYNNTGRISGGICDDCQNNTEGVNCEKCKPMFYQDPTKDITDPEVCLPCDCEQTGTTDDGICDHKTDQLTGMESGKCHCKTNVDGRRCDRCKNGYWNFDVNNPDGCQECNCNILGTAGNQGCHQQTGHCTCKPYVTGHDCNACLPEYWGLSDEIEGCKPCDCDLGGAFNNSCNVETGQCYCRPHVTGRTCDQPEQSFYTSPIDWLIYEAELSDNAVNTQQVMREPLRDGRNNSWTGTGFMMMIESSVLNFTINDVRRSMMYDIMVRYEATPPAYWDNATLTVIPHEPPNPDGPCRDSPMPVELTVGLPTDRIQSLSWPSICLERQKNYTVILQINKQMHSSKPLEQAGNLLIDSIVLEPSLDSIPFFDNTIESGAQHRKNYMDNNCDEFKDQFYYGYMLGHENQVDPQRKEVCKKYLNSIGLLVFEGGHDCACNATGSSSMLCDSYGGHCTCKPNVVGRRCDRCAPGTYGYGPEGCVPCDCDGVGAKDNFCDVMTGRCACKNNTYGRTCGSCEPGFWNFPYCKRCECNGHADSCESSTGACIDCRDFTTGHNCDRCIDTFYGDPTITVNIPCRACPCPGTMDSGHSYANRCSLDPVTNDVICECFEGYAGPRCDTCADNYYGNPEEPGGQCQPCECTGNIDLNRPGNCHPQTGECLQCLYNTAGPNCQYCKPHYYGDAMLKNCQKCNCNLLGTSQESGPCDHRTGQCPCLPNVTGFICDSCIENHWRIASGQGCDPCDCDVVGSLSDSCNPFHGTCECKPGFGGTRCNECQENFWGNPNVQCYDCECDPIGSASMQCDRNTGVCTCNKGMGGDKCDQCARSYIGNPPDCSPCGECFDNWDTIIEGVRRKTHAIIDEASNIQKVGTTGIYSQEFNEIESTINQVNNYINSSSVKAQDLDRLNSLAEKIERDLDGHSNTLQEVDSQLESLTGRETQAEAAYKRLKNRTDVLHQSASELKESANRLQVANVQGALNVTNQMVYKSKQAEMMADDTQAVLAEVERNKKQVENLLATKSAAVLEAQQKSNESLGRLNEKLAKLAEMMPELNLNMCGRNVSECSEVCGGAGCGFCGGLSCDTGAFSKAKQALDVANQQSTNIKRHKDEAEQLLRNMMQLKKNALEARKNAESAYSFASATRNQSYQLVKGPSDVKNRIVDLLNAVQATPAEVRNLAEAVLQNDITNTTQEIQELARKIEATVATLDRYSTDNILQETSADLDLAKEMEKKANETRVIAQAKEAQATRVLNLLHETQEAQEEATKAINQAEMDITMSEKDLNEISQITKEARKKANETTNSVNQLEARLKQLQTESVKNEFMVTQEIQIQARNVSDEARKVQEDAEKLGKDYQQARETLDLRTSKSKDDIQRAKDLLQRASELTADTQSKFKDLEGMESVYRDNDVKLKDLMQRVDDLNAQIDQHLAEIDHKSETYRQCTA